MGMRKGPMPPRLPVVSSTPASPPSTSRSGAAAIKARSQRPKPSDLIAHYESQGLDRNAASEKVIEDLQTALHMSFERYPMQRMQTMDKAFRTATSKLEATVKRLTDVEAKLDAKPGFIQVFGAGVAAGAFLQTVAKGTPYVLGFVMEVSSNIRKSLVR